MRTPVQGFQILYGFGGNVAQRGVLCVATQPVTRLPALKSAAVPGTAVQIQLQESEWAHSTPSRKLTSYVIVTHPVKRRVYLLCGNRVAATLDTPEGANPNASAQT
ncbi:MAG: hypothetical protein H7039_03820 [Bryobacteraceae bacterium]|nr:hypothetical protein [Bryobacteraceae bacterium]